MPCRLKLHAGQGRGGYKGRHEIRIWPSPSPFVRAIEHSARGRREAGGGRGVVQEEMVHGTLEVLLVGAKGLENTDYLCNMDPYAILKCRSQEQKSSIAAGKGSNPEWNENFVFTVSDQATDLLIKLMDSDAGTADDFVGEATIPLHAVYTERSILPTLYNVVKGEKYCGEIKVGLTFTPEVMLASGVSLKILVDGSSLINKRKILEVSPEQGHELYA
ncbi:hypothetical protein ACP70R_027492 [Stipagrostis hirtigluma subsp. patula]